MMAIAMPHTRSEPARERAREPELDRATLVRCKAHDAIAFRAFVVRYERPVFALLSRLLGRGANVEDLAQESFLRAYRAFPAFDVDEAARPSTWLLTIATRLALDLKKRRGASLPLDEAKDVIGVDTPETERARRELGRAIERAAAALSDDHRAAFVLAEFHDLSIAEIARALDIPENTAKTRLFRARQHMREHLRGAGHGER
jgi:RNA polymerase sigma-70 factor (ECF subfamily)